MAAAHCIILAGRPLRLCMAEVLPGVVAEHCASRQRLVCKDAPPLAGQLLQADGRVGCAAAAAESQLAAAKAGAGRPALCELHFGTLVGGQRQREACLQGRPMQGDRLERGAAAAVAAAAVSPALKHFPLLAQAVAQHRPMCRLPCGSQAAHLLVPNEHRAGAGARAALARSGSTATAAMLRQHARVVRHALLLPNETLGACFRYFYRDRHAVQINCSEASGNSATSKVLGRLSGRAARRAAAANSPTVARQSKQHSCDAICSQRCWLGMSASAALEVEFGQRKRGQGGERQDVCKGRRAGRLGWMVCTTFRGRAQARITTLPRTTTRGGRNRM